MNDIQIEADDVISVIISIRGKRVQSYAVKTDEDEIYIYIPPEMYYDGYSIDGLHQIYGPLPAGETMMKGAGKMKKSKKSKKRSSKKTKKAKKSKKTKRSKKTTRRS